MRQSLLLLAVLVLGACRPTADDTEVAFYLSHPVERSQTLQKCQHVSLWVGPSLQCYHADKADSIAAHQLISKSVTLGDAARLDDA